MEMMQQIKDISFKDIQENTEVAFLMRVNWECGVYGEEITYAFYFKAFHPNIFNLCMNFHNKIKTQCTKK